MKSQHNKISHANDVRERKLFASGRRRLGKILLALTLLGSAYLLVSRKPGFLHNGNNTSTDKHPGDESGSIAASLADISVAILPAEASQQEIQDAVDSFIEWLRNYREGIESAQFRGWQFSLNKKTPPNPTRLYRNQLDQLDRQAFEVYAHPLHLLDRAQQQEIIRGALKTHFSLLRRAFRFVSGAEEEHVIRHFLRFYFSNAYGVNRIHLSNISPGICRGWDIDSPPGSWPA